MRSWRSFGRFPCGVDRTTERRLRHTLFDLGRMPEVTCVGIFGQFEQRCWFAHDDVSRTGRASQQRDFADEVTSTERRQRNLLTGAREGLYLDAARFDQEETIAGVALMDDHLARLGLDALHE